MKRYQWAVAPMTALLLACGGDDGAGDGVDAGVDVDATPAVELPAEENEWVWVPIPGVECSDGSATGMGVNLNRSSRKLLVLFEGGGACFNALSCLGAAHQSGYFPSDFAQFTGSLGNTGQLARDDTENPFRDWSYVFFPYCTGDIFASSQETGFGGRNQVGYRNVGRYTDVLASNLGMELDQVVLSGFSAGGFGAVYNFDRIQRAFPDVPVFLLDDSAPIFSQTYMTACLQQTIFDAWGLADTLPDDCTGCAEELLGFLPYLTTKYSSSRLALVTSTGDGTIRSFFGLGYPDCDSPVGMTASTYEAGVTELRDDIMGMVENFKVFTIPGTGHVFTIGSRLPATSSEGVLLSDWLTSFLSGEGWDDVAP